MKFYGTYRTPEGFDDLVMVGDEDSLTGLSFLCQNTALSRDAIGRKRETAAFRETRRWLDEYSPDASRTSPRPSGSRERRRSGGTSWMR